ncbi:MAG: lytic transglycosylase domain-containing protein [Mesorhizobium sp.]|nr:lytic transglycosylase domain-containing protein [Mesorhizobium sp.]MBL8577110.1 lytic transglycosylase domain-containing protein [Mesorhizobium sp.]
MIRKLLREPASLVVLAALSLAWSPAAAESAAGTASASPIPDAGMIAADGRIQPLKSGLDALGSGDISGARRIRDTLPPASVAWKVLAWAIAMDGGRDVPSSDIAAAAVALPNWPGAMTLRRNSERALYRENPDPRAVVAAFGASKPQTLDGVILLARANVMLGRMEAAREAISPFWQTRKLEAPEEQRVLGEFSAILTAEDHRRRMERMLYSERVSSADRVARLANAEPLAKAWAAVIRNDRKAAELLQAVPAEMRSAGYYFAEAKNLRRKKKFAEAAEVVLKAPTDRSALIDPDAWWLERRVLSRELVDIGDMKLAYRIAAAHAAESPVEAADAEFHAGWYALRGMGDAKTGARHFARLAEIASGPISLSRAYYWLGRSSEAGAAGDAKSYYEKAAAFGTTFYGQLAAERIGGRTLNVVSPEPSAVDRDRFERREVVRAIRLLERCDNKSLADMLYRSLAEELDDPAELSLLASMAADRGNQVLALRVGKIAAGRGLDIGALSHPVGAIPDEADISAAGKALAYAIARQESEFNVSAVSNAGALGLLQLMPATAKSVAKKVGLSFFPERLTTDAAYNATLGAAFLGEQLGRFDGSYILTFAGYNAGPGRAREWIRRYGDPRGQDVDAVVDWIERIPFAETRTYVQRVMENYQVYKMRLSGTFDIEGDLVKGRRRVASQ